MAHSKNIPKSRSPKEKGNMRSSQKEVEPDKLKGNK